MFGFVLLQNITFHGCQIDDVLNGETKFIQGQHSRTIKSSVRVSKGSLLGRGQSGDGGLGCRC